MLQTAAALVEAAAPVVVAVRVQTRPAASAVAVHTLGSVALAGRTEPVVIEKSVAGGADSTLSAACDVVRAGDQARADTGASGIAPIWSIPWADASHRTSH